MNIRKDVAGNLGMKRKETATQENQWRHLGRKESDDLVQVLRPLSKMGRQKQVFAEVTVL